VSGGRHHVGPRHPPRAGAPDPLPGSQAPETLMFQRHRAVGAEELLPGRAGPDPAEAQPQVGTPPLNGRPMRPTRPRYRGSDRRGSKRGSVAR